MTVTEKKEYKKAYVELNEIIKNMSKQEKQKIPKIFIENLTNKMDKDYIFVMDNKKNILEQNLMVETKALLVELYERYLAPDEEKEFWKKYDKICLNKIEKEKEIQYSPNTLFVKKNEENCNIINNNSIKNNSLPVEVKEKNIFIKFLQIVKEFFHID